MKKKMFEVMFIGFAFISLAACSNNRFESSPKPAEKASSSEVKELLEESTSSETKAVTEASDTEQGNSKFFDLMIEAAQSQIPAMKEQMGTMYSDMTITAGPDYTVIYTLTYLEDPGVQMDSEALKPVMVKAMKPIMDSVKGMLPDAKIQVIYLKPDQTELGNILITQEDTDAIQDEADPI